MSAVLAASGSTAAAPLHAFEAVGLELEYTIVDRAALDVLPIADAVLQAQSGSAQPVTDYSAGELGWSNELALHVMELKNLRPTAALAALGAAFQEEVRAMNRALAVRDARLMPGGMHPWMDPARETKLWPHGNSTIYAAYDGIFDCRRHGWANLQSVHVNLPFGSEEEFARLHAAVRVVLPILPALTAASPYADARGTGFVDYRMEAYRTNAERVPEMNGALIPDACLSRGDYEAHVLAPLFRAIAPLDPAGVLQHDWLNARGAIARFERSALEIRVVDAQECPRMDVGCAAVIADLTEMLYEERFRPTSLHAQLPTRVLAEVLLACIRDGERTRIAAPEYLALFGVKRGPCTAGELWEAIAEGLDRRNAPRRAVWSEPLEYLLLRGPLARRLLRAVGARPDRAALHELYCALCDALEAGRPFDP